MGQSLTRPYDTSSRPSTSRSRPANHVSSSHNNTPRDDADHDFLARPPRKMEHRHGGDGHPDTAWSPPPSYHTHDMPRQRKKKKPPGRPAARGISSRTENASRTSPSRAEKGRTHRRSRKAESSAVPQWLGSNEAYPVTRGERSSSPPPPSSSRRKPLKKTCSVCMDARSWRRFPQDPPTQQCAHDVEVCRRCLRAWIESEFERKVWDQIICPTAKCGVRLGWTDVRVFGGKDLVRRYNLLARKKELEAIPGFRWCTMKGCQSGQVHDGRPKFSCKSCRRSYCIKHKVPWHSMMTCKQYDKRVAENKKKKQDVASQKVIKKTTKKCPGCKASIEKNFGCDHMTCAKCHHEFCWQCRAPHDGAHSSRCIHYAG